MIIPTESREELSNAQFLLGPKKYLDFIWRERVKASSGPLRPKARSHSWPITCRTEKGFVLQVEGHNVTPIRRRNNVKV